MPSQSASHQWLINNLFDIAQYCELNGLSEAAELSALLAVFAEEEIHLSKKQEISPTLSVNIPILGEIS